MAFHEKAGRSQVDSSCFLLVTLFFPSHSRATVATLPSALFDERFLFRSVQVGCSRYSRCCHLIVDLSFHLRRTWARPLTQSPKLGLGLLFFLPKKILTLCGRRHRFLVTIPQRFVNLSTHPQPMQQHRQLSCRRNHCSLLPILAPTFGQVQTPAPQIRGT